MVALIINCLILGDGNLLEVEVNDDRSVSYLKKEIAKKNMYDFPANRMKVYLAQREGAWFLSSDGDSVRKLKNGEIPDEIEHFLRGNEEIDPLWRLQRYFDQSTPIEGTIHVLVKLPATGWKRQKIEEQDVTAAYAKQLLDVDVCALNTPQKLEAFIFSPLPLKYPTREKTFEEMLPDVFEYSECTKIEPNAFRLVTENFEFSSVKSVNHFYWDSVIRVPLEKTATIMGLLLQVGRYQTDESTTLGTKKPDFLLWLNETLVFKGIEKGPPSQLNNAKEELLLKMKKMHLPVFGQMPFLFTYAAANSWVQFFVIDHSSNMFRISPRLNLMDLKQRIRCVLASINICRILYHYESLLPQGFLPTYMEITRNHCRVTLYEDFVLKKLDQDPYDFDAVIAIYEAIRRNQIECTVRCEYDRAKRTLKLRPLGFLRKPTSDVEMIAALICVARALVGLHALKFVHRDIRWPNILCLGDDAYMLIDFESAGNDGDPLPGDMLGSKFIDPLVSETIGHQYQSCHDMYQFGKLIEDFNNASLQQLRMNLMSPNAANRHTAETALKFLADLQNECAQPSIVASVSE